MISLNWGNTKPGNYHMFKLEQTSYKDLIVMQVESLYVHFPFCRHLCNYCDFHKSVIDNQKVLKFHQQLENQISMNQKLLNSYNVEMKRLSTLYIGGGTPSLWGDSGVSFLLKKLKAVGTEVDHKTEFTIELNPGTWTEESILNLVDLGVNRFSVGVQSLNPDILKKLDRIHSVEDVYRTLELLKKLKVNYSVDFMLGLPSFEKRDLFKEIDEVATYEPSHISSYILTVNKSYKHYTNLPDEDFVANEYLEFVDYLKKYEIYQYEVSNFAKIGFESKHNLQYWKSNSVAALGPSATGLIIKSKSAMRYRWKVGESSAGYTTEILDEKTLEFEKVYLAVRQARNLDLTNFFPDHPKKVFDDICKRWFLQGLVTGQNSSSLSLTPKGFLLLDSLFSDLFKYLKK